MRRWLVAAVAVMMVATVGAGGAQVAAAPGVASTAAPVKEGPLRIALTFDDLPAHGQKPAGVSRLEIAQSVLQTLKREGLPPVYGFVNGVRTEEAPETMEVLRAWRAAGEPLGSHTWSHPDLDGMTAEAFEADVVKNEALLGAVAGGSDWHWFRYPYLHEGDTMEKHKAVAAYLEGRGYRIAEVTLDFEDYLWNAPYSRCMAKGDAAAIAGLRTSYLAIAEEYLEVFRGTTRQAYGREVPYVLLLHLGAFDAEMLPALLARLRLHGAQFVSLEEAERDPAYRNVPMMGVPGGGTLQEVVVAARGGRMPPNAKPYRELEAMCQ